MKPLGAVEKKYEAKVKLLKSNFADMLIGQKMAIGTPDLVASICKKIPKGKSWSLSKLRNEIAKKLKADTACPVTTSMYLRIAVSEAYKESLKRKKVVFPFWRVVEPNSPLFKKLDKSVQDFIIRKRELESID
ncbi:MAG: hypothetical protein ACK5YL_02195 [Holosporales bacterium]|jgi:hypothetical protein